MRAHRERVHDLPLGVQKHVVFLLEITEIILATIEELQASIDTLVKDANTALDDIKAEVTKLESEISDPAVLQPLKDKIDALDTTVKAADPGAPPAAPSA